jgi:hypothetical protein
MASEVFIARLSSAAGIAALPDAVGRLADAAGISQVVEQGLFYMLKVHFGERGNNTYVNPSFIRPIISRAKAAGGRVFVSDTNTLYVGSRANAVDHLTVAREHGFTFETLDAPVIIADGLLGESQSAVEVNLKHYRRLYIANDARASDGFLVVTNVTGHMQTGLGAAIKNIGMGLAGRGGKRSQHCDLRPDILPKKCIACGTCAQWCPASAITVTKLAHIDPAKCIGCGECYAVCRHGAVQFNWNVTSAALQEKLVEHCFGVLKGKLSRCIFFNFLTAITLNCNCMGRTEKPELPPIGVLASTDIVAIDQASADVAKAAAGEDLFLRMYPSWDYTLQLSYAEEVGLGSRSYDLVEVS